MEEMVVMDHREMFLRTMETLLDARSNPTNRTIMETNDVANRKGLEERNWQRAFSCVSRKDVCKFIPRVPDMRTNVMQIQVFDVFSPALAHLHLRHPILNASAAQYFFFQRIGQVPHATYGLLLKCRGDAGRPRPGSASARCPECARTSAPPRRSRPARPACWRG